MKGIFFNLAQEVVEDRWGADLWDDTIALAGVGGAYTWFGTYADADMFALVRALSELVGLNTSEALIMIGRYGFPSLAAHHDEVLAGLDGWRSLITSLDGVIHPEAGVLHPGAVPPRFDELGHEPGQSLRLRYRSDRSLCALAEGLLLGVGDWFGTPLVVEQRLCVHRGDAACVIEIDER